MFSRGGLKAVTVVSDACKCQNAVSLCEKRFETQQNRLLDVMGSDHPPDSQGGEIPRKRQKRYYGATILQDVCVKAATEWKANPVYCFRSDPESARPTY